MPNYIYKCVDCDNKEIIELPISFNPEIRFACGPCGTTATMTRRIGLPSIPRDTSKVFAGDWFKQTYGHDMGEVYEDKARQQESRKQLEQELKRKKDV